MATNTLQTEDAAVQAVLNTLESHVQTMMSACNNVESINSDIQANFQAECSTAYQQRINDWQDRYTQLKNAYQTFTESVSAGHKTINNAHDEALQTASGWSPSDYVYNNL